MSSTNQGSWEPVRRIRTYEQVLAQIEQRMLDGELSSGDRLPGEREFAQLLGVSRPSLREALRVLEALGIVESKRGRGAEGGTVFVGTPGGGFATLLKMQLALGHFSDSDVLRTRTMLEEYAIGEAARHAEPADHAALRSILDQMDSAELSAREFNRLDTEFHVRLAESTGNSLAEYLMSSLRTAIQRRMIDVYEQLPDWRETAKGVRAEHRALLAAVEARDVALASRLVREHINALYTIDPESGRATPRPG